MRIIISPAKRMNINTDIMECRATPAFLAETTQLMDWMRELSFSEAKELWKCNDKIAELNFRRFQEMDLERNLTPALLSYEGIQYQYMAPEVFSEAEWDYVQEHLRILSGFYGVVKPLDGVAPYRLEMQAKVQIQGKKDLYEFWGDKLCMAVKDWCEEENGVILNLASKEYSRCIERYLKPEDKYITCIFGERKNGKVVQKGTQAKMARGEMVRFLAAGNRKEPEDAKEFCGLGYHFEESLSSESEYIFSLTF